MTQIAKELNVSVDTVERRLKFAEKANLLVDMERQLMQELVPAAMKAVKTALEDGDSETAIIVLQSMGILKDPKAPKTQVEQIENDDLVKAIGEVRELKQLDSMTVEGQVISHGRGGLAGLLEARNPRDEQTTEAAISADWTSDSAGVETNSTEAP